jgi:hypothetical protein
MQKLLAIVFQTLYLDPMVLRETNFGSFVELNEQLALNFLSLVVLIIVAMRYKNISKTILFIRKLS